MHAVVYGTSFMLIVITAFTFMSINRVEHTNDLQNISDYSITLPESTSVFSTIPITFQSTERVRYGAAIIRVNGNRLWPNADSIFLLQNVKRNLVVNCSFSDTGIKKVECLIVLQNSISKTISRDVVVYLPLQPQLAIDNDSLVMITPAVKDTVNYIWEFENGLIVCANNSRTRLPILDNKYYAGKLYVECAASRSPEVKFDFTKRVISYNR